MLLDLQTRRFTQILEGTRESRPLNGPAERLSLSASWARPARQPECSNAADYLDRTLAGAKPGTGVRRGHHRKRSQTNPNAWNNFAAQTGLQDVTTNPLDDSMPLGFAAGPETCH